MSTVASPLASALVDDAAKQRRANFARYAELLADSMPVPGEPPETVAVEPQAAGAAQGARHGVGSLAGGGRG